MSGNKTWSGVTIDVQSEIAAALPISGITKASPGVLTYASGTDPSDGDYVVLTDIQGMHQVDDRIFRVDNPNGAGNTFELEGEATTSYGTFSSGNASVLTFGYSIGNVTLGSNVSGGDRELIDQTPVSALVRQKIPGVASEIVADLSVLWDPANTALTALAAASRLNEKRAVRFTFADGTKWMFYGYVAYINSPTGQAQDNVLANLKLIGKNFPITYSA